ncbi:radical SAM family heme chaperone HemW [Aliiruegeria sabulilitoris]|uniref:radical SAM family heme chaperone HemW n=1 Tax=Aliiruegeria sabulilitoris TaxID=1510458 RepID=UPI0008310834|nr:radical SAM family heme chaperone HemW [Aliiruegeria sabulilitoris]NDR57526.1 coproporphyrinogen III oxidase [Pseudoruegeria sp. M32A2M]
MRSPSWSTDVLPVADWQNAGFGLYLHWPFCQSKCPYCDFNSHVAASIDQARWADAYVRQISLAAGLVPDRKLDSVFFGGGTPSLMAPETVGLILEEIRKTWPVSNNLEVTLEANPSSVEVVKFEGFRDAGINRVSLGVQALNDGDLARLGRLHSTTDARKAFEIARKTFSRVSFDLIYARQDQSLDSWRGELERALEMAIDHLSLYQLTIEPETAFGRRFAAGGLHGLPDEDLSADMYDLTVDLCAKAGLELYEISNFARKGSESRHNILYWTGGDYLGIGPGAHGRVTLDGERWASVAPSNPVVWLEQSEVNDAPCWVTERLTPQDRAEEYLMMGLRLTEGISFERLMALGADTGMPGRLREMEENGMIRWTTDRVQTTERGRSILNAVLRELLAGQT